MPRRRLDLTGQRFGRLHVVAPAASRGGRTYWLCLCDCGAEHRAATDSLKQGNVRSCGCLFRQASSERMRKRLAEQGARRYRLASVVDGVVATADRPAPTWRDAESAASTLADCWR
jgi:hypothetical protein